ncbi:MAG: hypothetical protein ACOH2K_16790 [Burkholderiaceae bacterium]
MSAKNGGWIGMQGNARDVPVLAASFASAEADNARLKILVAPRPEIIPA